MLSCYQCIIIGFSLIWLENRLKFRCKIYLRKVPFLLHRFVFHENYRKETRSFEHSERLPGFRHSRFEEEITKSLGSAISCKLCPLPCCVTGLAVLNGVATACRIIFVGSSSRTNETNYPHAYSAIPSKREVSNKSGRVYINNRLYPFVFCLHYDIQSRSNRY